MAMPRYKSCWPSKSISETTQGTRGNKVATPKRAPEDERPQVTNDSPDADKSTPREKRGVLRTLGLGLITGAADDDPSAIGTYASAGAAIGPAFLWTAPVTFPMMCAVVYLSAKLGQVSGKGLFHVIKDHYPRWILWPALIGVLIGNTIEAGRSEERRVGTEFRTRKCAWKSDKKWNI